MPAGAPSKYDPSYCDKVIAWGKEGKSRTWIASELGVVRQTLHNWEDQHEEFLDAMARAKQLEQRWWEDAGQVGMMTQGFGQSVWSRSMAARFPEDWREKKETTHGVTNELGDLMREMDGKSKLPIGQG